MSVIEKFLFTSTSLIREFELADSDGSVHFDQQNTQKRYTYKPMEDFYKDLNAEANQDIREWVDGWPYKSASGDNANEAIANKEDIRNMKIASDEDVRARTDAEQYEKE